MTADIDQWLAAIGLPQYAEAFRANHIDGALLGRLTADDLKDVGVSSLGHRIVMLDAIAALGIAPTDGVAPGDGATGPALRPPAPQNYTPRHLRDRILQSRSALEGERKQVSVLFADVQGSMELAGQLDPEQWHQVLEGFFAILTEGVHRFEGTVNQYTGDGIMALFGAPIAHEDHAQRACFTALHLQREITRYATEVKREHGVGFSTRLGINSGEVVVGRIGDDLRMDYTAQGHTVGLAQRMESLAEPNACYLGPTTAGLVRGYFSLDDLGDFRVKGVAQRVRVHRLAGLGEAQTRFDVSRRRGLSRFVGRDADLRLLEDALAQAGSGNGQVVGVVAQAGTGKSRLCFEFLERCRARGMRVWEGRAVAHGRNIPLLPILDLFRAAFDITPRDDARTAREKIAGRVVLLDASLADALPLVFELLAVGDPQRVASPALDAQARQRQLLALLARLLRSAGEGAPPTVALLEDLHWLDPASAEFVEQLAEACSDARCLLLLNFRPEYRAVWMQRHWCQQVLLTPLGPAAVAELVAGLLGRDASITALARDIYGRTAGNPFFAEEVVQSLIESGQLEGAPGAYRLHTPSARLEVPATVQAVLAARIDRLPEREKLVLQNASVIGKHFAEPLLAAVAGLDADDLKSALDALRQAEFIRDLAIYPVTEYAFKHPLTQEVALGGQLRERRRQVHASVAHVLEQQDAQHLDEQAALLAHHWDEAGDAPSAARWHRRAAEWSGCPDFASAIHHWQRVRMVLRALPEDPAAVALRITACTRLLTLGQRVGASALESRELLDEAQALADASGDRVAAIRLAMAYGWSLVSAGDLASCLEMLTDLQRQVDDIDDPQLKASVWGNLVLLNSFAARFAQALALVAKARANAPGSAPAGKGVGSLNAAATLAQFEGFCLAWMGHVPQALLAFDTSLRLADEIGELAVFARSHCAELHYRVRDPARALENAHRAQQISLQLGNPAMLQARVVMALAHAHLAAGRADEAVTAARAAVALHHTVDRVHAGVSAQLLAEALLQAGDLTAALAAADEAITLCRHALRANYGALAHGVRARALLRRDGAAACDAAQAALDTAAGLIDRTGAHLLAPALAEWRAELAGVRGDIAGRQHWLDASARGFEAMRVVGA